MTRVFVYVGPTEIRAAAASQPAGIALDSPAALRAWWDASGACDPDGVFTFVVTVDGVLRVAPRRSEHVACAGGGDVLAAGELAFADARGALRVTLVTNLSTGYCPSVDAWPAVAAALDATRVGPASWTTAFRRCVERRAQRRQGRLGVRDLRRRAGARLELRMTTAREHTRRGVELHQTGDRAGALAAALDATRVGPTTWTTAFELRLECGERNVVKDDCGAELPRVWNLG